jgi:hypothetical protein
LDPFRSAPPENKRRDCKGRTMRMSAMHDPVELREFRNKFDRLFV